MKIVKYIVVTLLLLFAVIGDIQTAIGSNKTPVKTSTVVQNNKQTFAVETSDVWTPTFQLCWNEFIKLVGTPGIQYIQGNPELADELNKQKFDKNDLSDDSYYISVTKMTKKHKQEIEKAIWAKFQEKSDILDDFKFDNVPDNRTDKWFIYSMLLKNFKFFTPYKVLDNDYFSEYKTSKYKYFGFMPNKTDKEAKETLENGYSKSLFYVNDNDFALQLTDKDKKEEMILYITNSDESFETLYNEILEKSKNKSDYLNLRRDDLYKKYGTNIKIKYNNYYKIPFIKIDEKFNFDKELANKDIKDKTYDQTGYTWTILKTLQTVKFDMDNEGAKLKSEAAIAVLEATAAFSPQKTVYLDDYYYFDRPFVIFLKETGKDKPYFAARIKDGKYLVKE